jgi:hypothetical protein
MSDHIKSNFTAYGQSFEYEAWFEPFDDEEPIKLCAAFRHRRVPPAGTDTVEHWSETTRTTQLRKNHAFTLYGLAHAHFTGALKMDVTEFDFGPETGQIQQ